MNAFEVQLSGHSFEAGGKVRGTVIFREAFSQLEKAAGVRVQLVMGVTGSGSKESKQVFDAMVHSGPVRAPTQLSFEAALPANGPCSYEGRYVKIGWQCKVSVDVEWAIDPVVIESFKVVPRRA
jgi:hypothetical protein